MFFISLSQRVTYGGTCNGVKMDETTADSRQTQSLLEQVQTGDSTAFEQLFARHKDYLRNIIEMRMDRRLKSRFDASDVLQETHLEVSERLQEYLARRPMPFRLWLRKTAQQRLLRMRRAHAEGQNKALSREVPLPHRSSVELAQQLLGTATTPSKQIGRHELARLVRAAIGQLAEAEREMLLMRNFEGLTVREVGCILDLDPGTVSRRHGKALMRLAKILLETGFTESQL